MRKKRDVQKHMEILFGICTIHKSCASRFRSRKGLAFQQIHFSKRRNGEKNGAQRIINKPSFKEI